MDIDVLLKETTCLRPCEQSKTQTIELSGLDRISPAILYTVFFYKSRGRKEANYEEDVVEKATKALQKVLVSWYPAAGRLRINENTGKLEIDCNNGGVIMTTAVCDSKLEDLARLQEYKPCYEKLVPQIPEAHDISKAPLVVVQITRFNCGGYSVGFGGNHALFDGVGAFNLLASWAHISSGKDESELVEPNHSREALLNAISQFPGSIPTASDSIYEQNHVTAIQDLYGIPMQAMSLDDKCWGTSLGKLSQFDPSGVELLTLCVKGETVDARKRLAIERGKLSKCSTFDVLCAHVWKARVKSLLLPPDTNICLQFPVDSRSRLQPPLGENFTGNAFVLASVSCLAKELLEETPYNTIEKIQAAKQVITDEYVKLYTRALESSDKFFPSMRELTIVTDWMKFPFHALDFGWGQASSASILATPVPETAYLMLNLEEPGAFAVRIGIEKQYVKDFISNFNDCGKK
ncbi:hypothetical protein L6164_001418 [Bauhinia variegata]|uniref:Uncharacterized protein n=1 Tax=Bauhinia variegata TaxID=167791 RepID=A0ACB9QGB6_BAUVA|nr:hypothetical protein L6164_001418 [Bauhinia variegata]